MKPLITAALMLIGATLLQGQEQKKGKATVRIKKIENINGVEKITDTTYTTDDPSSVKYMSGTSVTNIEDKNGKKIVVIKQGKKDGDIVIPEIEENGTISIESRTTKDGKPTKKLVIKDIDHLSDSMLLLVHDFKDAESEMNRNGDLERLHQQIVNVDVKDDGTGQKITKIVIIANIRITDASADDANKLGKPAGISDNKLSVKEMKFYPNPGDGKFTLSFNLPEEGNTDVTIMNLDGKSIYSEKLASFKGQYEKQIDISSNPKGVYFVKITQGEHSQLKKIVLE
jgi:hypothetical protein